MLVAAIVAGATRASTYNIRAADVPVHLVPTVSLALLSLFVHEFGHATACARFGARPHEIGFGIYLLYPAFYSDVSDAWFLTRWQRVVVDLGGIYFQAVAAAVFVGIYELTGWQPLRASLFLIVGSFVFTINPFFKFDGYWIISDALGVTNLRDQWRTLAAVGRDRLRSRQVRDLPWPKPIVGAVVLCSIFSCILWTRFVINIVPMLIASVHGYTVDAARIALMLRHSRQALTIRVMAGFALRTYVLACALRIGWQCTRTGWTWCRRTYQRRCVGPLKDSAIKEIASEPHPAAR